MCIFCQIIKGELPASIIYEDEHTMAFLDINPMTRGHVLIVPKIHAESIMNLPPQDAGHLMRVGQLLDAALRESSLDCEGVNFFLADGRAAGQEVFHVHLHVFPRFTDDGLPMLLDPSLRLQPGRDKLNEDAKNIRSALEKIS